MRWSVLLLAALLALALLAACAPSPVAASRSRALERLRDPRALVEAESEVAVDAEADVDADADADADVELDAEAEAEVEAEVEAELNAEAEAEAEMEAEAEAGAGFTLTAAQLQKAVGCSAAQASTFLGPINAAAAKFAINTAKRMAGFLAQVGHETGGFDNLVENLNYDAAGLRATFPSYFNAKNAAGYARQPQKIANRAYAGRMGNGNEASGDGWKYRGRGLIQITGKSMYQQCGSGIGQNLVANPDLLTQPAHAAMSAAWFWSTKGCNSAADSGNVRSMTTPINAGLKGLADRQKRYNTAKAALGVK